MSRSPRYEGDFNVATLVEKIMKKRIVTAVALSAVLALTVAIHSSRAEAHGWGWGVGAGIAAALILGRLYHHHHYGYYSGGYPYYSYDSLRYVWHRREK